MVRHAPIHRRSGHSDIAICCGRNVRGSSPSTLVVPLSNQVTTLNHKRFKGFKMFSDGHLEDHLIKDRFPPPPEYVSDIDEYLTQVANSDKYDCQTRVKAAIDLGTFNGLSV